MSGFYRAPITPGQSWFSPIGGGNVPAAGGTIDTFLATTVTPAPTYSDNTGGTSNGTQITLNSEGRLPNVDVWLPGGVAYKFVIKDALGNPIETVDNITGENDPAFASGGFSEWIDGPAATWLSATSFSAPGDQLTNGPWNRDRRVEITSGAGVTRATITSSIYTPGTNLTTVTFEKDSADPAPTNPISATRYGIISVPSTSFPSAALVLGAARRRDAGNTNTLLFLPIGSNLVTFLTPPDVVASAGGAGNQIVTGTVNGVVGSLTFNKTAHGRVHGEVVQVATSNTLPGGVTVTTDFIVFVVDANNFGLYAKPSGWQFEQPYMTPNTTPGGLTWGNPVVFSTAGVGNQTVTAGFEAPAGVTRVYAEVTGGGGGGAGGGNNVNGSGGGGGASGGTAEGWLTVTPGTFVAATVGAGGALGGVGANGTVGVNSTFSTFTGSRGGGGFAGVAAASSLGGTMGSPQVPTGGAINSTGSSGQRGQNSVAAAPGGNGQGGSSIWGGGGLTLGAGGNGGDGNATGSAGAAGVVVVRW